LSAKFLHVLERLPKWITRIMGLSATEVLVTGFAIVDFDYLKIFLQVSQKLFHKLLIFFSWLRYFQVSCAGLTGFAIVGFRLFKFVRWIFGGRFD
jgi:mannose/fructose/N-acetylgalactosamine-specific phosphotransferase system component IIC